MSTMANSGHKHEVKMSIISRDAHIPLALSKPCLLAARFPPTVFSKVSENAPLDENGVEEALHPHAADSDFWCLDL